MTETALPLMTPETREHLLVGIAVAIDTACQPAGRDPWTPRDIARTALDVVEGQMLEIQARAYADGVAHATIAGCAHTCCHHNARDCWNENCDRCGACQPCAATIEPKVTAEHVPACNDRCDGDSHWFEAEHVRGAVIAQMTRVVREINRANGWLDDERTVGDDIALLHSEASEALEAYRDHGLDDATDADAQRAYEEHRWADARGKLPEPCADQCQTTPPKPEGFGSELADVLIRLLDTADRRGVDLVAEFERKSAYNATRGHRHGGKLL